MAFGGALGSNDRANAHRHQILSIHRAEADPPQNDDLCRVTKEIKDGAVFDGNDKQSQMCVIVNGWGWVGV